MIYTFFNSHHNVEIYLPLTMFFYFLSLTLVVNIVQLCVDANFPQ